MILELRECARTGERSYLIGCEADGVCALVDPKPELEGGLVDFIRQQGLVLAAVLRTWSERTRGHHGTGTGEGGRYGSPVGIVDPRLFRTVEVPSVLGPSGCARHIRRAMTVGVGRLAVDVLPLDDPMGTYAFRVHGLLFTGEVAERRMVATSVKALSCLSGDHMVMPGRIFVEPRTLSVGGRSGSRPALVVHTGERARGWPAGGKAETKSSDSASDSSEYAGQPHFSSASAHASTQTRKG